MVSTSELHTIKLLYTFNPGYTLCLFEELKSRRRRKYDKSLFYFIHPHTFAVNS